MKLASISKIKKILAVTAIALVATVVPVSASAAPNYVEGQVTINGTAAKGAKVIVTCNGNAKTVTASSTGFYSAKFSEAKCPEGATFNVTAKKGNKGGVTQGTVTGDTTTANVNVTTVAVPEFGPIVAIGTVGLAGAGFWAIRRRTMNQNGATLA